MSAGYDAEVADLFRDLRAASNLTEADLAARISTPVEVVQALEQGAIYALPPWPETCRVVSAYGTLLNLDTRPLLRRIYAQLEAGVVELGPKPVQDVPVMVPPAGGRPAPAPQAPQPQAAPPGWPNSQPAAPRAAPQPGIQAPAWANGQGGAPQRPAQAPKPQGAQPQAPQPKAAQPQAPQPRAPQPQAPQPQAAQPQAPRPQPAPPQPAQPRAPQPQAPQPQAAPQFPGGWPGGTPGGAPKSAPSPFDAVWPGTQQAPRPAPQPPEPAPQSYAPEPEAPQPQEDASFLGEPQAYGQPQGYEQDPSRYDPSQYDPSQYDPAQYDPAHYDPSQYGDAGDAGTAEARMHVEDASFPGDFEADAGEEADAEPKRKLTKSPLLKWGLVALLAVVALLGLWMVLGGPTGDTSSSSGFSTSDPVLDPDDPRSRKADRLPSKF